MANEQRSREEKGTPDRQGQDQHSKAGKGGQGRDDDKNRREQNDQARGSGQQDRTTSMADEQRNREKKGGQNRQRGDQHAQTDKGDQPRDDDKNRREGSERERGSSPRNAS